MRTVTLQHDPDGESPSEWGGWKLVSFARNKFITDEDPDKYILGVNQGAIVPINIGLARKLSTGTAFWLSYYEHSDGCWSLLNEGPQCQFDTAWLAGILLWPGKVKDLPKTLAERADSARSFLEIYNCWANGDIYYFCVDDEEGNSLDSCGGFYGNDLDYMFKLIAEHTQGHEVEFAGGAAWLGKYHEIPKLEPVDA